VWVPEHALSVRQLIGNCRYLELPAAASADRLDVVDEHVTKQVHRNYGTPFEVTGVGSAAICRRTHRVEHSAHVSLVEQTRWLETELGADALYENTVGREADVSVSDGTPKRPRCGERAAGTARGDPAAILPLQRPIAAYFMRNLGA